MSCLEILLYAYLAGWIGTSTYGVVTCEEGHAMSKTTCRVVAVGAGAIWPAVVVSAIKDKR